MLNERYYNMWSKVYIDCTVDIRIEPERHDQEAVKYSVM